VKTILFCKDGHNVANCVSHACSTKFFVRIRSYACTTQGRRRTTLL